MSGFNIAIVGAGFYGTALALAASCNAKHLVRLIDVSEEKLAYSTAYYQKWMYDTDKIPQITIQYAYEVLERITWSMNLEDTAYANLVFESIDEDLVLKNDVIRQIDNYAPESTVIASTTNHLSIGKIARNTKFPHRVLGMHFPQYPIKYNACEVVAHSGSSQTAVKQACDYAIEMSFKPTVCIDAPGFIANRALYLLINEAIFSLHEGVARKEDIDNAVRRSLFNGLGPLELADYIGLDVLLEGLRTFHKETGDDKFRPCPLLAKMVEAGILGRKTNQGFFEYNLGEFLGRSVYREQSFNGLDQKMKEIIALEAEIKKNHEVFYNNSHIDFLERFNTIRHRNTIKEPEDLFALEGVSETREKDIENMKKFYGLINQHNEEVFRGSFGGHKAEDSDEDFAKDETYEKARKAWAARDAKNEEMNQEMEIFRQSETFKEVMFPHEKDELFEDLYEKFSEKPGEEHKEQSYDFNDIKEEEEDEEDLIESFLTDKDDSKEKYFEDILGKKIESWKRQTKNAEMAEKDKKAK